MGFYAKAPKYVAPGPLTVEYGTYRCVALRPSQFVDYVSLHIYVTYQLGGKIEFADVFRGEWRGNVPDFRRQKTVQIPKGATGVNLCMAVKFRKCTEYVSGRVECSLSSAGGCAPLQIVGQGQAQGASIRVKSPGRVRRGQKSFVEIDVQPPSSMEYVKVLWCTGRTSVGFVTERGSFRRLDLVILVDGREYRRIQGVRGGRVRVPVPTDLVGRHKVEARLVGVV